jgi:hypothetical protein
VIENLFCSRKLHGEYDLVGVGRFDLQEGGSIVSVHIETTGGKQGRR